MATAVVDYVDTALDAVAATDLDTLTDRQLSTELVGLIRGRHRLDAEIARRAARWDSRVVWLSDGSRSPAARLCRDGTLAYPEAKRILRRGHAAAGMPVAAAAWTAGEISGDHLDLLARAAGSGRGELFARDEAVLVGQCAELSHREATKAVQYWCQRADAELGHDGPEPVEPSLELRRDFDGSVAGRFVLDPIGGATVQEALRRIEQQLYRHDKKTGVVRRKDERLAAALVEMAVRACTPKKRGRRPEPLVLILAGEATVEHLCELGTGTVIDPGFVVPHLARADVQTFIFDGADRVVTASNVRTFRGTLRRAIQVRDRHCQHASGCDAPIVDCDINHKIPYARGGKTSERGGELECQPHNRNSDLHDKAPHDVIDAARHRRELEAMARERIHAFIAEHSDRPPPTAA